MTAPSIPHKPPALLLDSVDVTPTVRAICQAHVRPDHPLVHDGRARTVIALELMAQAAACVGVARADRGPPRLVACREITLHTPTVAAGEALVVTAERIGGDEEVAGFSAWVDRANGERVADARFVLRCVP